jgi:RHS repeat-associated protein
LRLSGAGSFSNNQQGHFATTNTTLPPRYTYTGQYSYINDEATDLGSAAFGLVFYNARWLRSVPVAKRRGYDPYITQFSQPDSIVPDPYNSQDWDRYSYARNNPLVYTDPSGHCAIEDDSENCYAPRRNRINARVFYLNGLGGQGNNDIAPRLGVGEYNALMYWLVQAVGRENVIHIPLFTSDYEGLPGERRTLGKFDMYGESLGIRDDWTDKALDAIRSELEENPLGENEKLVIVGSSAGGTVAAELLDDLEAGGIFVDQLILRGSYVSELNLTNVGEVDYIAAENPQTDEYYSIDVNPFDAVQVQEYRIPGLMGHVPRDLDEMNNVGSLIVDLIGK